MNRNTVVIIPVYNEAEVIESVIVGLKPHFSNIVCVDDGSSDESAKKIQSTGVDLVRHARNRGQGAAIRTGIEYALGNPEYEYFVTFDADGQHRVSDVLNMLSVIKKKPVDIVLGSRFLSTKNDLPMLKRVVLRVAIAFSNATTGLRLTDTHNGLRVMNRKVADKMHLTCRGMAHASEIIYRIRENRFKYAEVPVNIIYSKYSKAKGQSVLNSFNILRELVLYRMGGS